MTPATTRPAAAGQPGVPDLHPDLRQDVVFSFVAQTPLHVGGLGGDTVVDLPLATDGQDRLFVPGSSWAGVLRAFTRRHLGADVADELFGVQTATDGFASRLTVSDTVVGSDAGVELRTGVGIDRRSGAAANRVVYDRLVLPAGTELELRVRYEGPVTDEVTVLASKVRALGLRLGAASSRGLGLLCCTRAITSSIDLTSRAALLAALADPADADAVEVDAATDVDTAVPTFELTWRTRRPVVVGGPSPGESADLVPLLTRTADGLVPVLPGSSVKGVLRTITERVLRTVLDLPDPTRDFVASASALAKAVPAFEALFGSTDRAGALSVPDVTLPCTPVRNADWRGYLATGSPAPPWSRERTHVAIDRWTGGAAESRLFTVQETEGVRGSNLLLQFDENLLPEKEKHRRAVVVLLGVAVALLREGGFGLGHGTTRGLGEIEVTAVTVTGLEALGLAGPPTDDLWGWLQDMAGKDDLKDLLTHDD